MITSSYSIIPAPLPRKRIIIRLGSSWRGISSKALKSGYTENKKKYNGIEHNTDFDLNMYDAFYRNLDSQIGRFWQIDPKPTGYESPYATMGNNPILKADFMGDTAIVFGKDGGFLRFQDDGKKTISGRMITGSRSDVTVDANGNTTVTAKIKYKKISLNDGTLVAQAVRNKVINRVEMISDAKIEEQMNRSGVKTDAAPLFNLGPGTYDPDHPGYFDASSDQRAIGNGYNSSPAVIKAQQEIQLRINNYMQNWRPYQN